MPTVSVPSSDTTPTKAGNGIPVEDNSATAMMKARVNAIVTIGETVALPTLKGLGNGLLDLTRQGYADLQAERAHELALVQANAEYATRKLEAQFAIANKAVDGLQKNLDAMVEVGVSFVKTKLREG